MRLFCLLRPSHYLPRAAFTHDGPGLYTVKFGTYVHMYVRMYIRMYVRMVMWTYVCECTCVHKHTYIRMYYVHRACMMHIRTYVYTYLHTYLRTYVLCTWAYVRMFVNIVRMHAYVLYSYVHVLMDMGTYERTWVWVGA